MEITREQIKKIIELAGAEVYAENVDEAILSRLLVMIEQKMNFFDIPIELSVKQGFSVLIVDDLELTIFQFTKALQKIGVTPVVARNKEEALAEIKKTKFDYVITDLFLPEFKDGKGIIDEITKLNSIGEQKCRIIAISSTNNKEIIDECTEKVDKFVTKSEKWHEEILRYIAQNINKEDTDSTSFSKYFVDDNKIVVYTLAKINSKEYIKDFLDEINVTVVQGVRDFVVNFEKVNFFDMDNAFLFTELFKIIKNQDGRLILTGINKKIKNILEETYIIDILKIEDSLDDAIEAFTKEED